MSPILYCFKHYWRHRIPLSIFTLFCSTVACICDLLHPLLGANILNYYFVDHTVADNMFAFLFADPSAGDMKIFGRVAITFGAIITVRIICVYLKNITLQANGLGMETEIRHDTYKKLMELDTPTISSVNSGEMITLIDSDTVTGKEIFSRDLLTLYECFLSITISIVLLITLSPTLLIMPVIFVPFFLITLVKYRAALKVLHNERRDDFSDLCLTVNENLRAVRIVRSYANEELEKERFYKANHRIRDVRIKIDKVSAKYGALFSLYNQFAYTVTLALTAYLVIKGNILLGSLSAATSYVLKIMGQVSALSSLMGTVQYRQVALKRITTFLQMDPAIVSGTNEIEQPAAPHVEIRDISLSMDGTKVLDHVSLDLPYGKKVGIMGETGCGKSVLLKALSRVFEVDEGEITVDGQNIKEIPLETLRLMYGYVFQDVFLFSRTIDTNIAYFDDTVEDEEILDAAKVAEAHNFITQLPKGYGTIVGERGVGISGGQKQRISIARALMKHAPILVLDDASSALDMTTERKVMAGIKEHCPDVTLLIAAHRVSSVEDCDEILFMDEGRVVERGTLEELLALNGRFAAIWHLQHADGALDDSSYGHSEVEAEGGVRA